MRNENRMLDATLDAVTPANIDIVMYADIVSRDTQRARNLIGVFRHLDRCPDVQHLTPWIPFRDNSKRLDRNRRVAPPLHAKREMVWTFSEVLFDLTPHERLIEQYIGSMLGVHVRA